MTEFLKKHKNKLIAAGVVLATLICAFSIYVGIYYRADDEAVSDYLSASGVKVSETARYFAVGNEAANRGLIFYPGGKVDPSAYLPLAAELARQGIFTVIVKMPFNLAVFGINAANRVMRKYSSVKSWYIGGHSLGGSMAAEYAAKHADKLSGVVLLGAYSNVNLAPTGLPVFVAYGSEDRVLNMEKFESKLENLPSNRSELIIAGGNHAGFGMYGAQRKDGEATISKAQQMKITAEMVSGFTRANEKK